MDNKQIKTETTSENGEMDSNLSYKDDQNNDNDKLSEIIGDSEFEGSNSEIFKEETGTKKLKSYPEEIKEMMENADQLSKKVALNSALLEKLKTELISHKMKYAENKMILADVIIINL